MDNNDNFLEIFLKIEKFLNDSAGMSQHLNFSSLLAKSSENNSVLVQYNNELRLCSNIRNILVHQNGKNFI